MEDKKYKGSHAGILSGPRSTPGRLNWVDMKNRQHELDYFEKMKGSQDHG